MQYKPLKYIVLALLFAVVVLIVIAISPLWKNEVTTPDNAILIAKAEILRRYGEQEIEGYEFEAFRSESNPNYWYVFRLPVPLGDAPHVIVRYSDGKAKMRWK